MFVVAAEISVDGWSGAELHVGAQVVPAGLAEIAVAAWHAWFDGDTIALFQVLNFRPDL